MQKAAREHLEECYERYYNPDLREEGETDQELIEEIKHLVEEHKVSKRSLEYIREKCYDLAYPTY
jgi:hypothetical protein